MISRVLCILALVSAGARFAMDIRRLQNFSGGGLRLRGDIKEGDYSRLKSQFRGSETIVGLDVSSAGGILEEGLRIADLVRRKELAVYVDGKCNSACAFIFFFAAKPYVGNEPKIGVPSVSNSRDIEDTESMLLTMKLARISASIGVPQSAVGKMVTTH